MDCMRSAGNNNSYIQSFSYSGPAAWNCLPSDLGLADADTSASNKRLNEVLFRSCLFVTILLIATVIPLTTTV